MNHRFFYLLVTLFSFFDQIIAQEITKDTVIINLEIPELKKNEEMIRHTGYSFLYNEHHELSKWVAYNLKGTETEKIVERSNNFFPDPAVKTGTSDNPDYSGSGYDRGHLAPAADMSWSQKSMEESFLFGNISPQLPAFNRGIWKKLEEQVRSWAVEYNNLYIVTGPILKDSLKKIGPNQVSVPEQFYKIILDYSGNEHKAIAFLMHNQSSTESLKLFSVTIDSIEKITGINFFPNLPDRDEKKLEKTICIECWSWEKSKSKKLPNPHHNAHEPQSIQCHGITKSGTRCKNMTKAENGYCNHHENQAD